MGVRVALALEGDRAKVFESDDGELWAVAYAVHGRRELRAFRLDAEGQVDCDVRWPAWRSLDEASWERRVANELASSRGSRRLAETRVLLQIERAIEQARRKAAA